MEVVSAQLLSCFQSFTGLCQISDKVWKMERTIFIAVACLFIQTTCVVSRSMTDSETVLIESLLSSYNPMAKASEDEDGNLNVTMNLEIIRLDGWENNVLSMRAWVTVKWVDQRLAWHPTNYNDLKDIRLPASKIWTPDLYLYNDAGSDLLFPDTWRAIIHSDGSVMVIPSLQLKSTCIYDDVDDDDSDEDKNGKEKFFCKLKFGSWTYSADKLDLFPEKDTLSLDNYSDTNAEWKITRADATKNFKVYPCCPERYVDVTYRIRMKRKN